MTEKKGIIERAEDAVEEKSFLSQPKEILADLPEELIAPKPAPFPTEYTYFVYYTCEVMGKQLAMSKVFNFQTPIMGSTFDSIQQAIAQHEKVAEVVIANFIPVSQ